MTSVNNDYSVVLDYPNGIYAIDIGLVRPGLATSYLMTENQQAIFIEAGTSLSCDRLLEQLNYLNIPRENVPYVIVTHIHLDHAGGAGQLLSQLPNAKLIVHPRGERHMADPSKLIAGATAVYGKKAFKQHYGEILPIPSKRILVAEDQFELNFNGRRLVFLDTPGHANHHFCVWDEVSQGFFTGDTFGLSYRSFDTDKGPFILPTTTPIQFNPSALHSSIQRLMSFEPKRAYLTHFGMIENLPPLADELHTGIDHLVSIALEYQHLDEEKQLSPISQRIESWLIAKLKAHGCEQSQTFLRQQLQLDINLNAQGLCYWLNNQKDKQ